MKRSLLCVCMLLLTAAPLAAETYSWVDADGVCNFCDDLNRIPKKYRKGAKRIGDDSSPAQPAAAAPEKGAVSASKPPTEVDQLYSGKSQVAWRKEFDRQEAELNRLELRLEELQGKLKDAGRFSRARQTEMFAEYEAVRMEYKDKYKHYSDLIESARKSGLTVEIKK